MIPPPQKADNMKSIMRTFNKSSNKPASKSTSFKGQQPVPLNPGELPFKPTIRLQINLPHNQLMVLRLMPDTILSEIKQMICTEKSFDPGKYLLVKPFKSKSGETPLVLDLDKSLNFYHINEVTVLSNKVYQELSKQFSTSSCNQFTSSMYDEDSNRLGGQVDLSQSTPNIANGLYKRSLSETHSRDKHQDGDTSSIRTARSYKRKPAPPPPLLKTAKSMQNLAPIRDEEEERPASEVFSSYEHHDSSSLSEHSTTTEASKLPPENVVTTQPSKHHHNHIHHHRLSRQNSGSDSSGYHEMLSHTETDNSTPTNSPAPPVSLSPNPSENPSTLVSNKPPPVPSQRTSLSTKPTAEQSGKVTVPRSPGSVTSVASSSKKRRAPLPPAAAAPPSVTQDSTQSTIEKPSSAPPSPRVVKLTSTIEEPSSSSRLSISSESGTATASVSGASAASSSSGLDDSKLSSLSDSSLSPIVVVKSSNDRKSISVEDIDGSVRPRLNSTEIAPLTAQPENETESKLEQSGAPEVIETKDKPTAAAEISAKHEPSKLSEQSSTSALQPPEETEKIIMSPPDAKPVEQPKVEEETVVQLQIEKEPVESHQKRSTDQSATDSGSKSASILPSKEAGVQPTTAEKLLPEQSLPRGGDEKVVEKEARSQIIKVVTTADTTGAEKPSIASSSSAKADIDSHSSSSTAEVEEVQEVSVDFADQDQDPDGEKEGEMNGSLKRPSVVTISEWKTTPKDNELLLLPGAVVVNGSHNSSNHSTANGGVSRSNSTLDRNLQKQVEVTLNELNDTLDAGLDSSPVTPPSMRKKTPFSSAAPKPKTAAAVAAQPVSIKSSQITVENGKSKININSVPNGERRTVQPPKQVIQKEVVANAAPTKVSVGSMKDLPSSVQNADSNSNENVSISPMRSVRDSIAKFSVASTLRNNNLGTSKANYSMSHQDLTSLNRSLPNTPAGTLARRSSSKVGVAASVIPEAESPQVSRKLANFRIGSFKKELDIFEQPKSPVKEQRQKPILTTGQWKSEPSSAASNLVSQNLKNSSSISSSKPSQPSGETSFKPSSPAVITRNGTNSADRGVGNVVLPAKSTNGFALPKESAKKVFNPSNATIGAAGQNGERNFLQELKSRTWSHRTGLSTFDEEESTAATKTNIFANSNAKRSNVARQPDLYAIKQQQPQPNQVSNGSVTVNNKPSSVVHQSPIEPKAVAATSPVISTISMSAPPPPPPPPPPPTNGQIDLTLVNRSLSPELKQTNTLLAPKGWKSVKVADQPKQIRSPLRSDSHSPTVVASTTTNGTNGPPKSPIASSSSPVDQHDALLNEIRNFQNKSKLRKVANNEPFTLAVNGSFR